MADERYRSDITNRHASPTQGGRTSSRDYGQSYSAGYSRSEGVQPRAQRYDSPSTQDCYPSGRPKTQRQYADDSHARYAEGGYSARATSHEYGADRSGSSTRYAQQPSYAPQAGYDQDGYSQSEASWRGGYAQDGYEQGDYGTRRWQPFQPAPTRGRPLCARHARHRSGSPQPGTPRFPRSP